MSKFIHLNVSKTCTPETKAALIKMLRLAAKQVMEAEINETTFDWVWRVTTRLPERKGQLCRVLVWGKMNSVLVEFEDGFQVVTSRNYLRKKK